MHFRFLTGRPLAGAAALLLMAAALQAQIPGAVRLGEMRSVSGLVEHPGADSVPAPVAHLRVVLHRVGQDTQRPIDSTFTDAHGAYRLRYETTGAPDAVYFASASYDGIAYFTPPLQAADVASPDGDILVFDTTSHGITLELQGRHIVVGAPSANGTRQVAEVFDLGNDGTKTLIARDTQSPLWTTQLPAAAVAPAVSGGDVAAGAVAFVGTEVRLFAPVSPGIRQLAVGFTLPASAFPLSLPMTGGAGVLEVMLEEASATPSMPGLSQRQSVTTGERTFKRYLAQDVPDSAVLRIDVGAGGGGSRTRLFAGIAFAMAILLAVALT
ncbi:MAG: hypothetical protein ACREN3_09635, partial [Gemmatimonadaceae bacterium]